MLLRRTAMFTLSVGLLAPAMAAAATLDEQVRTAYAAWDAAFGKSDAKAIGAFYTDDAFFLPPTHDIIRGPAGVEKFFAGLFTAGRPRSGRPGARTAQSVVSRPMSSAGRPTATSSSGSTPSTNLRCLGVPLARLIRSHLARRIQHGRDVTPLPGRRVGRGASIHVMSSRHSSLWRCCTSAENLKPRFRPRPRHVAGAIAQAKHGTFAGTGGEVAASPLRSYLPGNPEVLSFAKRYIVSGLLADDAKRQAERIFV